MSIENLSHTSWKCKYHIVFTLKYRRPVVMYNQIKKCRKILRQLCEKKKLSNDFWSPCKFRYGNRHFWCRGYSVNTAGADTHAIAACIQNQLAEGQAMEQSTFKEYIDPFTKSRNQEAEELCSYSTGSHFFQIGYHKKKVGWPLWRRPVNLLRLANFSKPVSDCR